MEWKGCSRWRGSPAVTATRVCLAIVFLAAALAKSTDIRLFAAHIKDFQLVPDHLGHYCALAIVAVELTCALFLLFDYRARFSALLLAACTLLFTLAMVTVLVRGFALDCNCFGGIAQMPVGPLAIGRNTLLLAGLLLVALGSR